MKVNFQKPNKILCIILSATICVCACVVSVSADNYSGLAGVTQNDINYIKQTLENAQKLVSGEITVREAVQSQTDNCTELISQNVKDMLPYTGLTITETELNGLSGRDLANRMTKSVRDCLSTHGGSVVPTEATETSFDLKGYGCCVVVYESDGWVSYTYAEYGFVNSSKYRLCNLKYKETYRNGSLRSSYEMSVSNEISELSSNYTYKFYGDWRNFEDGTPATDITTPTQNTIYTNDPSSLTDTQLIDLLNQMINQLKLDMPDLSTIEGLLAAILSQCQSINGKICTSSEIRSMLDEAISQLNNGGGGGMSSDDVEKITCALDNLKYENNNEAFISDLKNLIGMNGDYDEISKLEVVKSHFYEKAGFITELRNLCETAVLAYKQSDNSVSFDLTYNGQSYNVNFDFWEQYMPMFRFMLAAVIYLSFAWRTYRKIPFYISGGGDDN